MSRTIKVAACQMPEVREDAEAALRDIETWAARSESAGADVVCFPECYLQGYLCDAEAAGRHALDLGSPAFATMLDRLDRFAPTLVIGLIERDGGRLYNTAAVIRRGRRLGTYRKTHLLSSERIFLPGTAYPVFETDGLKFGINICYDTNFPEAAAAVAAQGATVLLCPANNLLPTAAAEVWKDRHHEVRGRRAAETGLWVVSADVTGRREGWLALGPTSIINPAGKVVAQVPLHEAGLVMAEIGLA